MIDDLAKNDKEFYELLLNIGKLTLKEDTKEYLKLNLSSCYDNRKKAEEDVIKYSLKVLISMFIYLILINTTIENISIGLISIKDLWMVKIFFPIVILYYSLLMSSVDLFRIQNTILYYNIQAVLYPEIIMNNLSDLFIPFSFVNLLSKSPSSNKFIRISSNLSYYILFGFVTFIGFLIFPYSVKYGIQEKLFSNIFFIISLFIQASLILLTVSVFTRKVRFKFLDKKASEK